MKLKICGMMGLEDIAMVNRYKPDYIGFIFAPNKRRTVSHELAAQMKAALDPSIKAVGVFINPTLEELKFLSENGIMDIIQLHGNESVEFAHAAKEQTGLPVIKALTAKYHADAPMWDKSDVDFLLLDSGTGSGETFDWSGIPQVNKPWFLAGGISPENIGQAVKFAGYGIDCSSGVEENGRKSEAKIQKLFENMEEAL